MNIGEGKEVLVSYNYLLQALVNIGEGEEVMVNYNYHLQALVNIAEGEEVLVSYNYRMEGAPEWYSNHWFDHLRQVLVVHLWMIERYNPLNDAESRTHEPNILFHRK